MEKVLVMVRSPNGIYHKKVISKDLEKIILERVAIKAPTEKLNCEGKYNSLIEEYPEIEAYKNYFLKIKQNNSYVVIMKQAVVHHMMKIKEYNPIITSSVIAYVLNLKSSAVRSIVLDKKQKHDDYNEVVLKMDKMINKSLYPYASSVKVLDTRKTVYDWK